MCHLSGPLSPGKPIPGSWQPQSTLADEGDVMQRLKELQERDTAKAAGARMRRHMHTCSS
jgi:hypothetical protein